MKRRNDFNRFQAAVTRQTLPDAVPLAENDISIAVMEAFLGRPMSNVKTWADFWLQAGYDYVLLQEALNIYVEKDIWDIESIC